MAWPSTATSGRFGEAPPSRQADLPFGTWATWFRATSMSGEPRSAQVIGGKVVDYSTAADHTGGGEDGHALGTAPCHEYSSGSMLRRRTYRARGAKRPTHPLSRFTLYLPLRSPYFTFPFPFRCTIVICWLKSRSGTKALTMAWT